MGTRTGNFGIGFRRGWGDWQADFAKLIEWSKDHGFDAIDTAKDVADAKQVIDGGLRCGSVDLLEWQGMISESAATRKEAVEKNAEYVKACAEVGALNHFVVMLPEDTGKSRADNFGYMVESFKQLAPAMEEQNAKLVIEGWPGPGALCCSPETYREFFKQVDSPAMGVNYDPSHLIRMGVDPLRFIREFAEKVYHVHGKDTIINWENIYELGHEQPATFAKGVDFGTPTWRYCIPGHGVMNWVEAFSILEKQGYTGCVCIELEDCNFNRGKELEGLNFSREYLQGC